MKGLIVMFGAMAALNALTVINTVTAMNNGILKNGDGSEKTMPMAKESEPKTHLVSTTPSPCINSKNTVAEINEALNKAIS